MARVLALYQPSAWSPLDGKVSRTMREGMQRFCHGAWAGCACWGERPASCVALRGL